MATIKFYGSIFGSSPSALGLIPHESGSGIGFFGTSVGSPVPIGETQNTTYITNATGTQYGAQLNNTKCPVNTSQQSTHVSINGSTAIGLDFLPNYLSTLNIRFEHETAVRTSQPKIIIFDRQSVNNHAVGVTTYLYEVRHPLTSQTSNSLTHRAKTAHTWTEFDPGVGGVPQAMPLTNSPGPSGLNTAQVDMTGDYLAFLDGLSINSDDYNDGGNGEFLRHDWYVALSSSPDDIGEKTEYGLYFTVDYL